MAALPQARRSRSKTAPESGADIAHMNGEWGSLLQASTILCLRAALVVPRRLRLLFGVAGACSVTENSQRGNLHTKLAHRDCLSYTSVQVTNHPTSAIRSHPKLDERTHRPHLSTLSPTTPCDHNPTRLEHRKRHPQHRNYALQHANFEFASIGASVRRF